jgi:histidyl-tRNA synthetase
VDERLQKVVGCRCQGQTLFGRKGTRLTWFQAEFSYKLKPKLPPQLKDAESASIPRAVMLGDDQQKAGKVKIKEMGLPEGRP